MRVGIVEIELSKKWLGLGRHYSASRFPIARFEVLSNQQRIGRMMEAE
jgi:hypothetical protein